MDMMAKRKIPAYAERPNPVVQLLAYNFAACLNVRKSSSTLKIYRKNTCSSSSFFLFVPVITFIFLQPQTYTFFIAPCVGRYACAMQLET
jgi:hypothetical protein